MASKKSAVITTAANLSVEAMVAAYNNKDLTNRQVVETLNVASWDIVRSKTRNASVAAQLTVTRVGGINGTIEGATAPATPAAPAPTSTSQSSAELPPNMDTTADTATAPAGQVSLTVEVGGVASQIEADTMPNLAREFFKFISDLKYKTLVVKNKRTNAKITSATQLESGAVYTVRSNDTAA